MGVKLYLMACEIDHSGEIPKAIGNLEKSQAGFWRHRCAGCSYLMGRRDAATTEERLRERVRELMARVEELELESARKR